MKDNYYVGLDLGTDSIGWAATDENYNFLRLKGKTAFGARLFSEAEDCKDRRLFRANRRRIQRRKNRIYLLNYLFAEKLAKVDQTFLLRLNNSAYWFCDKNKETTTKHLIFKNKEDEKNFYKKYKTIFHLRKALINNEPEAFSDIRYLYLALHHIIKYRGNFLSEESQNYENLDKEILDNVNNCLKSLIEDDFEEDFINGNIIDEFKKLVLNENLSKSIKKKEVKKLFNNPFKDFGYVDLFVNLCIDGKFSSLKKIFSDADSEDVSSIEFEKYDENKEKYAQLLGDAFTLVECAKKVYDFSSLHSLLKNHSYLSDAMIEVYEQHKKDLRLLKNIVINIDKKRNNTLEENRLYTKIFKDKNSTTNYACFIHNGSYQDRVSLESFNVELLKVIKEYKDDIDEETYLYLTTRLEKKDFLKTIAHVSTSVIPHQLHEKELRIILDNAEKYYPFISEIKDKIFAIFKFRVPYYSGPTNGDYSNFVRKSNEKIYPWNFNEIIDENKTKIKFFNKLTNQCKYIFNETVLPKTSLLYQEYMILDKLNVLQVNGAKLNLDEKTKIYNYITSRNKTTLSNLKTELKHLYGNNVSISGVDELVTFEASSLKIFKELFTIEDYDLVEDLIKIATIYADDKSSLKHVLQNEYKNLTKAQYSAILNLPTKKWSPFSKKLLDGIISIDDNGIAHSIISVMREENKNFQMVLNDEKYRFNEFIDEYNKEVRGEKTTDDLIEELLDNTPAKFRRSINQSLLILDDLTSIAKTNPKKIFIEVTREDLLNRKKKRTDSRKKELVTFLTSWKKDVSEYVANVPHLLKELEEIDEAKLKSKHIYLYFKQLGYDLYTGKPIDLNDVLKSDRYDTDHIIPQSLIKDDSLDNLVLVDRNYNQKVKKDTYPIPPSIKTNEVKRLWEYLKNKKSISETKYNRLIRNTELSQDELRAFVNSQINAVNYSNIVLRDILNIKYPDTQIIFSKAKYPSYLRKKLKIAKVRELNDAHHAVDAYLNIVAGNILFIAFSSRLKHDYTDEKTYNMERVLDYTIKKNNLKDKIVANCLRHDALITYKYDFNNGAFYKQTLYSSSSGKKSLIPIHTKEDNPLNDSSKYGGYLNLSSSKMALITYKENDKCFKRIEDVKLLHEKMFKQDSPEYISSIYSNDKATDIQIIQIIYNRQKVCFEGGIYTICTSNETQFKLKMAYQNYISNENLLYFNITYRKINELPDNQDEIELITDLREKQKIVISKQKNYEVFSELISKTKNKVYDSCNYIVKLRDIDDKEIFMQFNLKNQITIIYELIRMLSRDAEASCLSTYYKSLSNGKLRLSKNITGKNIQLIYESPTGLYSYKKDI